VPVCQWADGKNNRIKCLKITEYGSILIRGCFDPDKYKDAADYLNKRKYHCSVGPNKPAPITNVTLCDYDLCNNAKCSDYADNCNKANGNNKCNKYNKCNK
jgi:hypothetical protein